MPEPSGSPPSRASRPRIPCFQLTRRPRAASRASHRPSGLAAAASAATTPGSLRPPFDTVRASSPRMLISPPSTKFQFYASDARRRSSPISPRSAWRFFPGSCEGSLEAAGPGDQGVDVDLLEAEVRSRRDQQRRLLSLPRPGVAAVVEAVVDPGKRSTARVLGERVELPVRSAESRRPVEAEVGDLPDAEQRRQVAVGALFPAGRPDQVVVLAKARQPLPGG